MQVSDCGLKVRPNHTRCTVILREIPDDTAQGEIYGLFSGLANSRIVSVECIMNFWYLTFDSDDDAQRAYRYLREEVREFKGHPIMARIKAKPMHRTTAPRDNYKAPQTNGMRQPTNPVTSPGTSAAPATPPSSVHSSPGAPGHPGQLVQSPPPPMQPSYQSPQGLHGLQHPMALVSPPGPLPNSQPSPGPGGAPHPASTFLPTGHHGGGTVMVSTATTGTPCSTPNTSNTLIPGPPQASTGSPYMAPGPATQTYHIFLPTSQPGMSAQVTPYGLPTGGLLQPAPAIPGYPGMQGYFNIGMLPQTADWLQPNYKSSSRGGHGSGGYKGRGRGGRGGGGGTDRNTPVGSANPQASFAPTNSYQGYQQAVSQLPYSQYQAPAQQYPARRHSHNNWETSSQHSNSSQKKFSSSSSSGHDSGGGVPGVPVVAPQTPRLVQQPVQVQYQPAPAAQFLPQQAAHLHHAPRPALAKEQEFPGQPVGQYQYHHQHQPRMQDTIQTKEYVNKRGRGGRGGSSRGRDDGYNSVPRGGHTAPGPQVVPARNVVYHQGRHNSGGGPGGVIAGPQDVVAPQPRPEPPRPAPEFNMETNDFPALPGAPAPAPSAEPSRFLEVVKGTAKMKLEDDQEGLPEDLCPALYEEGPRPAVQEVPNDTAALLSPKSRSKNSSVSETPVVSVDRTEVEEVPAAPLVNGEVKAAAKAAVPVVSINAAAERESGSVSPRQQSLVSRGGCNVYLIGMYF